MTRTNQGGSVWSFVIVALVLAGLLVGGAYTIRKLTAQPDQSQPPAPAQQDQSSDKTPQADSSKDQPQTTTPTPPSSASQSQTAQNSSPSQLPQTGPEGLVGSLVAIAALSGMAVSYARSRRPDLSL